MKAFRDHPASVGETYVQHMGQAFSFGGAMLVCAAACFVHGVFPFLCTKRGSETITRLHDRMVTNRIRSGCPPEGGRTAPARRVPAERL
ncbi:MAG: DUF6356 family protein [Litorimonas sp.]